MTETQDYSENLKILVQSLGKERVKFQEKLSQHTFSGLGGPAEAFYVATSLRELQLCLDTAFELRIPFFIIGSGTKVLLSDQGIKGLVIKNRADNLKVSGIKGKVGKTGIGVEEALIEVWSGATLGRLNEFLIEQKLQEVTGFSSLKSSIGGSIFLDPHLQNMVQAITVWEDGDVYKIDFSKLNRNKHVVLSLMLKAKSGSLGV